MTSVRTEFCPDGESVELINGEQGTVMKVIAFWPAVRCWDVLVQDPQYDGVPNIGFSNRRDIRGAQIRGMRLGGPPWKEIRT